ncbi:hypothetical protein TEA_002398 [Camellia sinensis var. sinensis]|uniref:Disease resistance protein At4g27190-like leucine-rich repeats domain-containing protein n=1 Tax=Camellia sinensis var. sinensis TaxID=542762 RepID=A0A4S4D5Y3_CAMSN|nr:hypothetical protein TEA_002398 [Camellia sinensis var. sinensis]
METPNRAYKAHVLVLPYPAQGHINLMLQFSKCLVARGVKATLANSVYIFKSMHKDPISTIDTNTLIEKLDGLGRPVDALICDAFLPRALDVTKEFGIHGVVFFTQTCAINSIYYHVHEGLLSLPLSPNSTILLPGLPPLEACETPSSVYTYGLYPSFIDLLVNQFCNIDKANWVLFNTFYEFEEEVVDWMSKLWWVRTIGPTLPFMYLDKRLKDDTNYGNNLFKPHSTMCMNWLNAKPSSSVVYGNRRNQATNNFINDTAKKGLVVTWSPQLEVLAHESIGVPQWSDQATNAKFVEDVWGLGIRAKLDDKGIVRKEVLEACIKEVIEGEKKNECNEMEKIGQRGCQALWMGDLNATVQHIFGERKASKITELTKSNFDTVSYRVSLLEIESSLAINKFAAFESRKSMVKEIMKALDDDNINVIGGCGMGGVGTAGEIVDSKDLNAIAREVWRECGGLPIAIVTVGRALMKNPSKDVWIDAARQLQNPVRTKIKGMESYVYSSLELSYNYLESEEKPCFLLCSLFPKDNDIPKEALVRYGIGLGLFQEVDTTEDAGHRALAIVSTLVSSFMLLEVYGKIKMHDVVRYFAIHIACKEENKHIVKAGIGLTDWPDNHTTFQNYTGISFMDNHICELPSGLEFSKLEILLLQWNSRRFEIMQIPNNFSEGMKDLKVLDMSSNIPNAHMFPDDLRFEELVSVDIRTGKRGCVCQESFEKTLRLTYDCEGLKNILEDLDSDSFDQLKSLKLEECNETKYLLDMIDGAPRVLAPFCNLEELELWHLGNFSEICHGQLSAASFSYLRSVRFTSSGPLKLLFPPSLVQGLVHLQSLSCFCRNLEEIFPMQEKEQIGKSLSTSTNLQNLTHVTVHYSDSLTCFFTGGYAVEYPSLEQMLMRGCCKMKTFGRGVLMTPNLKKVHVRVDRHGQIIRNDRGIWKGDLNATVQHIFNESGFGITDFGEISGICFFYVLIGFRNSVLHVGGERILYSSIVAVQNSVFFYGCSLKLYVLSLLGFEILFSSIQIS